MGLVNHLCLSAKVLEIHPLRHTPAGIPAVNCWLEHESELLEAAQARQVKALVKAVTFGTVAERLARQDIGSSWYFEGFLATPKGGKQLVFHIQEFAQQK